MSFSANTLDSGDTLGLAKSPTALSYRFASASDVGPLNLGVFKANCCDSWVSLSFASFACVEIPTAPRSPLAPDSKTPLYACSINGNADAAMAALSSAFVADAKFFPTTSKSFFCE